MSVENLKKEDEETERIIRSLPPADQIKVTGAMIGLKNVESKFGAQAVYIAALKYIISLGGVQSEQEPREDIEPPKFVYLSEGWDKDKGPNET